MTQPKNKTKGLLFSITKKCETIKQSHTKPEEMLEFKLTKSRQTFYFNPPLSTEESRMIGLITLDVYSSIFNITEQIKKFQLYTDTFDEFSFEELKGEIEDIVIISNSSNKHLQDEKKAPVIVSACRKLQTEKRMTDGYYMFLMGYARSPFGDFESCLRIVVGLYKDDIWLVLKQYNANFVTYELTSGIYTIKDFSDAVYNMSDHEGTLSVEDDDDAMKTKLILTRFGGTSGTLRFDKRSFFNTSLGFTP